MSITKDSCTCTSLNEVKGVEFQAVLPISCNTIDDCISFMHNDWNGTHRHGKSLYINVDGILRARLLK